MVTAPRKNLVIMVVVLLVAAAVIVFARHPLRNAVSFALLSPTEKKLVGKWQTYSDGGVIVTTLRPDHTWTSVGGWIDAPLNGRWAVDGGEIVYSVDLPPAAGAPPLKPVRRPIQQLIDDDRQVRAGDSARN